MELDMSTAMTAGRDVRHRLSPILTSWFLMAASALSACTGSNTNVTANTTAGSTDYTVGGTVTGLQGSGLVLENNYGDDVSVAASGTFTFKTPLIAGNSYSVTVLTQPAAPLQTCTVTNGGGSITDGNVTSVAVMCADKTTPTDAIGGEVTGLLGSGLVLQNDGGDNLMVSSNGTFVFATGLPTGTPYAVTVLTPPMNPFQNCTVADGTGTTTGADVNDITVSCKTNSNPTYTIGGTISGITATGPIVLQDDGTDNLTVSADGSFAFKTPIPSASAYSVTALASSNSQTRTCAFTNASGVVAGADVTNINVACAGAALNVAIVANVSGLTATGLVLQDNGADDLAVNANGPATFTTPIVSGSAYNVTVLTQPTGQTCVVANGAGTVASGTATNITVTCAPTTYTIGGSIAGLAAGTQVTLYDNGGNAVTATNGVFAFTAPVTYGGQYAVTVATQPLGEICTVVNGMGSGIVSNVTAVSVVCSVQSFTIGGTVSGLTAGNQVTLDNNGGNALTGANGAFTFTTPVAYNGSYAVTIGTQPAGQTCTVSNGTGAGVVANVTNVAVTCATNTFTIGGAVAGLAGGKQVTLDDNGGNPLIVTASGNFTFTTPVAYNSGYAVTVGTQPVGQTCTIGNGTGAGVTANVTTVTVTCATNTFTIGGAVAGLAGGKQVTLDDNGGNPLIVTTSGNFTFTTPVAYNSGYAVTVGTQPVGQTCTVGNGTGAGVTANVTTVTVTCATNTYTIGGSVAGLESATQVTLDDNGGDPLVVNANGNFTFATPIAYNGGYLVSIGTEPNGQICSVTNGSGAGVIANVTNVQVLCSPITYTIGGTLTNLGMGLQVTLDDNGGNPLTLTANGAFTFTQPVVTGSTYLVAVGTQPVGETCSPTNATGTAAANVTNVGVTCSVNSYTIGGSISGLTNTEQVTLDDNGGDPLTILGSSLTGGAGNFTFAASVAYNGAYAVTVGTQPNGAVCTPANASGTSVTANVTTVSVACAQAYTIGGQISGLPIGAQMTLLDNGGDTLVITGVTPDPTTGTQAFTFATRVVANGTYNVTVGTQPTGYNCTPANNTGTVTADVTGVTVTCTALTYTLSGTVSSAILAEILAGASYTLDDNGVAALTINSDNIGTGGTFTFPTPIAYGTTYAVTVANPPTGYTCPVGNGSGTVTGNVTNLSVACSLDPYTIGGTLSGIPSGDSVTLLDNGGDQLVVPGNGTFTFATHIAVGGSYSVTFTDGSTSALGCTITNGSGSNLQASITNVSVSCVQPVNGSISGVSTGLLLTLTTTTPGLATQSCTFDPTTGNPTGNPPGCTFSNGIYEFITDWPGGTPYTLTVTPPTYITCSFSATQPNVDSYSGTVSGVAADNLTCSSVIL